MINIYLVEAMVDEKMREVKNHRLGKMANHFRKIQVQQRLEKLACLLGLTQNC